MTKKGGKAFVAGGGMTKFEKPGRRERDYPDNTCSTGSSSLYLARALVAGGLADCVLAVGFEKMERGSLKMHFPDRVNPMDRHIEAMYELIPEEQSPFAAQLVGNAGREHMKLFGTTRGQIAKIAEKNHRHSVNNPYAQFQDEYTLDEILAPMVHGMVDRAVEIVAQSTGTDLESTFADRSARSIVGSQMAAKAANEVYELRGVGPEDVQVIELHDCFASNELISYAGLGLCAEGEAGRLIDDGDVDYGGKWAVIGLGGAAVVSLYRRAA
jgi:acetyl-CoA acyltransferase